jgi:hypothetical protein
MARPPILLTSGSFAPHFELGYRPTSYDSSIGSHYLAATLDGDKNDFDSAKTYQVTLPFLGLLFEGRGRTN